LLGISTSVGLLVAATTTTTAAAAAAAATTPTTSAAFKVGWSSKSEGSKAKSASSEGELHFDG
jgi:hypothetical protein